jgi:hypothetical protein
MKTLSANQLERLAALVPSDLAQPRGDFLAAAAIDWDGASPLERFVIARLWGRSALRRAVAPVMDALKILEMPIRDLAAQVVHDPTIRARVMGKLDYANRNEGEEG